jgi:hypothetical protein
MRLEFSSTKLTEENFYLVAARHYDNPHCTSKDEFEKDLRRFQYLNRLFNRYENGGELRERLILNHIIVLFNCLGVSTPEFLFFRLKGHESRLTPFLVYLNRMPKYIDCLDLNASDISMDSGIVKKLREI